MKRNFIAAFALVFFLGGCAGDRKLPRQEGSADMKAALEALQEGKGRIISAESGHGRLTLMIDVVNKIKKAHIVGYGYVGKAVARLLHDTGYAVYIYDTESVECSWAAGIHTGDNLKEPLDWSMFQRNYLISLAEMDLVPG